MVPGFNGFWTLVEIETTINVMEQNEFQKFRICSLLEQCVIPGCSIYCSSCCISKNVVDCALKWVLLLLPPPGGSASDKLFTSLAQTYCITDSNLWMLSCKKMKNTRYHCVFSKNYFLTLHAKYCSKIFEESYFQQGLITAQFETKRLSSLINLLWLMFAAMPNRKRFHGLKFRNEKQRQHCGNNQTEMSISCFFTWNSPRKLSHF